MHSDLYPDDPDSVTNDLRDSAKGSNDGYDVTFSLTGYEPKDTELNNTVSSKLIDSQGPLFYVTPSSDQDMDDTTLGKLLAEVHRENADYRSPEGVFVSPSSMSVTSDRTGTPVKKSNIDQFCFGVRNAYSAHNQFSAITQDERMVDRTEKPVGEITGIAEERDSSSAQIRTLCSMNKDKRSSQNVARKFLITKSKELEQNKNAKFYRKNYGVSNRIFVKFMNKILLRWRN